MRTNIIHLWIVSQSMIFTTFLCWHDYSSSCQLSTRIDGRPRSDGAKLDQTPVGQPSVCPYWTFRWDLSLRTPAPTESISKLNYEALPWRRRFQFPRSASPSLSACVIIIWRYRECSRLYILKLFWVYVLLLTNLRSFSRLLIGKRKGKVLPDEKANCQIISTSTSRSSHWYLYHFMDKRLNAIGQYLQTKSHFLMRSFFFFSFLWTKS